MLKRFSDEYKRCHGIAPSPKLTLGQLIDDSRHCDQKTMARH